MRLLKILICIISLFLSTTSSYTPIVEELALLLQSDSQLSKSILYTLTNVPQKDWQRGITLPDLYNFFNEWSTALVIPSNDSLIISKFIFHEVDSPSFTFPTPLSFISPMWSLASETGNSVWIRDAKLTNWLKDFIHQRGVFMDHTASWNEDVKRSWYKHVNMNDYIIPAQNFTTFNEFFTRHVKPDLRPIDRNLTSVISPADGYVWVTNNNVTSGSNFQLKADNLAAEELLGYSKWFSNYINGGTAIINFLSATDFHRFWSPVTGKILALEQLGGLYVANGNPCCVGDHRRAYFVIDTGTTIVSMVAIGMYDISSIIFNTTNAIVGRQITKGDELGHFQYGGSEIITLFEPNVLTVDKDVATSGGTKKKVGQRIGSIPNNNKHTTFTTSFCDTSSSTGWFQTWSEEFNHSELDNTTWNVDVNDNDSLVRQSVGTVDNVYIKNGTLILRSQRQSVGKFNYTSGAVQTKNKKAWQGPTRVCVSAKLPGGGNGIWPAHWLLPTTKCWPTNGEIDIMEMINGDGVLHGTYHWSKNNTCNQNSMHGGETKLPNDWFETFHEYAVEYDMTQISFFVDGKMYNKVTTEDGAVFHDVPYYVLLNTAIGGPWPKPVDSNTVFPTYHVIDYVRVAQQK